MTGAAVRDLLVRGIRHLPAGITRESRYDPVHLLERLSTHQKQPPAKVALTIASCARDRRGRREPQQQGEQAVQQLASLHLAAPWNKGRYCPYPSASSRSTGMNRMAAEFMRYAESGRSRAILEDMAQVGDPRALERTSVRGA